MMRVSTSSDWRERMKKSYMLISISETPPDRGTQHLHELLAIAGQPVEDVGGLARALDARALRAQAREAAARELLELGEQLAVDLVEAGDVQQQHVAALEPAARR
jgi:hypothetical protein